MFTTLFEQAYTTQVNAWGTLFAALASIGSLVVGAIALLSQRRQMQLSVRPLGEVEFGDYVDHVYVKLANFGAGPLICCSVKIHTQSSIENLDQILNLMPQLPGGDTWETFILNMDGRAIEANGEAILLSYKCDLSKRREIETRDAIRAELSQLTVVFTYKDIFENVQPTVTQSLKWFSR